MGTLIVPEMGEGSPPEGKEKIPGMPAASHGDVYQVNLRTQQIMLFLLYNIELSDLQCTGAFLVLKGCLFLEIWLGRLKPCLLCF